MKKRLEGRVALITGGTSGIGAETARLFGAHGAKVMIVGRSEEKGKALASQIGNNAKYKMADITREDEIQLSVNETVSEYGKLDILFNNAGGPAGARVQAPT